MFTEDELLPIAALQHLLFCERQCALIHLEGVWADNPRTLEGAHLHRAADGGRRDTRGDLRVERTVALRSYTLGLTGKADVVEWHRGAGGGWRPFPVEYKRGRPKRDRSDQVQLCAQAICLEEALSVEVPEGALYYATPRRRAAVAFDAELRAATRAAACRLHEMMRGGITPHARREPKCESCSLVELCLPQAAGRGRSAVEYLRRELASSGSAPAERGEER